LLSSIHCSTMILATRPWKISRKIINLVSWLLHGKIRTMWPFRYSIHFSIWVTEWKGGILKSSC
jgi:hypothetical protein